MFSYPGSRATARLALLFALALPAAADSPFQLPIGDEARRDKTVQPALDTLLDTRTGEALDPAELPKLLAKTRLLLIGESHTSTEFHRVQEIVLRELHKAGRKVVIGLEMMPTDQQGSLDRWVAGELSEREYLEAGDWYGHWGYHWEYYRPIFQLARQNSIAMRGLNVPRDLVSQVRAEGFDGLEKEDRARLPPEIDLPTDEFRRLFLSYFPSDGGGVHQLEGEMLEGFLLAQTAWDAAMAWAAVEALRADPEAMVVVLVGSGHVAYGLGIARQAAPHFEGEIRTLIPVRASLDGEPSPEISASYADFVWGVAEERWERFPSLGVSTREGEGGMREVLFVIEESPAAATGLTAGDLLLTVDGQEIAQAQALSFLMAEKRWGDSVHLRWRRGEKEMESVAFLRRRP
ncbi:MAG: ChaN family lipoprotein [Acidobacteriota bacterium]